MGLNHLKYTKRGIQPYYCYYELNKEKKEF